MSKRGGFKKKLLVEGGDDQHVIWAICEKFKLEHNFDVVDCKGIDNLFQEIPVRFKESDIEAIGIVIDTDSQIEKQWRKIKQILIDQGFVVPEEIPSTGLIVSNLVNKKVGVWLMPNNVSNGMLEDFISYLIAPDDPLKPLVEQHLLDIEKEGLNKYAAMHKSKAMIHSWLALQEDPGTPMGLSITKKYFSIDEPNCHVFVNWLKNLFG